MTEIKQKYDSGVKNGRLLKTWVLFTELLSKNHLNSIEHKLTWILYNVNVYKFNLNNLDLN